MRHGPDGKAFRARVEGVTPDIVASAKGLGSGFPMGAFLATEEAARGMTPGLHGSTYGGNQLAMAVGNAVLDILLADGFLEGVRAIAGKLRARLEKVVSAHGNVFKSVRGSGLMLGLVCEAPNLEVVSALREAGLLSVPAGGNVVRILPPLIVEESHIEEAAAMIEKVAANWQPADG